MNPVTEKSRITRRRLLTLAGGTIGATALGRCGLVMIGTRQPTVELTESSCGGSDGASKRILVAYGSKCGSTGEVAEAIGQVLCDDNTAADVRSVADVTDVNGYQAVVVGSAIRMGQWLPEATAFVEAHRDVLSQVPLACFVVCMTLQEDTEANHREVTAYSDPIRELVQPVDVGQFAGAMDHGKLPLVFRLVMKGMKVPEGDFRDWNKIRGWAVNVRPHLLGA
jgi:menaquinone-dependent protoporphyrinogen oxidase